MFLSIIIPVFNVELYIGKCIESCEQQNISKSDYEIICINDGSTDCSLDIINEKKSQYDNIIVFSTKNNGVSSARNLGIEKARGEYIWFVDGDDFIQENILYEIKSIIVKTKCERLKIGVYRNESSVLDLLGNQQFYSNRNMDCIFSSIFSKKIIEENKLRFNENLSYYEDILFLFDFDNVCNSFQLFSIDKASYYYRGNIYSATSLTSEEKILKLIDSLIEGVKISLSRIGNKTIDQEKNYYFWRGFIYELLDKYLPKLSNELQRNILLEIKDNDLIFSNSRKFITGNNLFSGKMRKKIIRESKSICRAIWFYSTRFGVRFVKYHKNYLKAKKRIKKTIKHPKRTIVKNLMEWNE